MAPEHSCLDALNTRRSIHPPSSVASYCIPLCTTRLSLLPNPHPQDNEEAEENLHKKHIRSVVVSLLMILACMLTGAAYFWLR